MEELKLNVWRLHPVGIKLEPAEKTLKGTANEAGVKWCGPYNYANSSGWWAFPPVDVDILWKGGKDYEHKLHTHWSPVEHQLVQSLATNGDPTSFAQSSQGTAPAAPPCASGYHAAGTTKRAGP